jgi:hypothetical protein
MNDQEINRAFNAWSVGPGTTVTPFSIFKAGYEAASAEMKSMQARIRLLERENAWLESGSWPAETKPAADAPRLKETIA